MNSNASLKGQTSKRANRSGPSNNSQGNHGKSRPRNSPQDRCASPEGVYQNGRLMHATTSLVGNLVQVVVKDGNIFEGILKTFSPNYEVVVEMVTEVDQKNNNSSNSSVGCFLSSLQEKKKIFETLIFKLENVVMLNLANVDLDFAARGFTDADINKKGDQRNSEERDLVPWDGGDDIENSTLEESESGGRNGWKAEDMFTFNKNQLKVQSTFDGDLSGTYTTHLTREDTVEFRQKELQAEAIARQIEGGASARNNADQNGDERTEEDKYSAVVREGTRPSDGPWRAVNRRLSGNSVRGRGASHPPRGGGHGQPRYPSMGGRSGVTSPSRDNPRHPSRVIDSGAPDVQIHNSNSSKPIASVTPAKADSLRTFSTEFRLVQEPSPAIHAETDHKQGAPPKVPVAADGKGNPSAKDDKQQEANGKAAGEVKEEIIKKSTLNPNAKEFSFNPNAKVFMPRAPVVSNNQYQTQHSAHHHQPQMVPPAASPAMPVNYAYPPNMIPAGNPRVPFPPHQFMQQQPQQVHVAAVPQPMTVGSTPMNPRELNSRYDRNRKPGNNFSNQQHSQRTDYPQQVHHGHVNPVQAATGHPVHLPGGAQMQVSPFNQQGPHGNPGGPPMYAPAMPLYLNAGHLVQRQGIGMIPHFGENGMPQYYSMPMQMMPQNMVQQNNPHSAASTPQSQTPTTPLHGGPPTPTPVHHSGNPNQPPTPTPQPAVMFAQGMPPHSSATSPYGMPVFISSAGLHQGGHMHSALSHNPSGNHHGIPSSQSHVTLQGNHPNALGPQGIPNFQQQGPPQQGRV